MMADSDRPSLAKEAAAPLLVVGIAKWYWELTMFRVALLSVLGVIGIVIGTAGDTSAQSNDAALHIEAKIPLGEVRGRIDHMAADIDRHRLFVAELGNNTVGIVDVEQAKVLQVLAGLKEPQGIGYLPSTDTLYVANGGDGSLRLFQGPSYTANSRVDFRCTGRW